MAKDTENTQNEAEATEEATVEAEEAEEVQPDFSLLSQVSREALERGDNPRSLSPDQYALYAQAVAAVTPQDAGDDGEKAEE